MYHAANISDLDEAIEYIFHERPNGIKLGIGVSLGACVLANYIAYKGNSCPLKAAVGVACHFDLEKAMDNMATKWFGFYDLVLGYYTRLVSAHPILLIDNFKQIKYSLHKNNQQ